MLQGTHNWNSCMSPSRRADLSPLASKKLFSSSSPSIHPSTRQLGSLVKENKCSGFQVSFQKLLLQYTDGFDLGKSSGCCCCFWLEVEHTDELKGLCVSLGLRINPLLLYFLLLNKKRGAQQIVDVQRRVTPQNISPNVCNWKHTCRLSAEPYLIQFTRTPDEVEWIQQRGERNSFFSIAY